MLGLLFKFLPILGGLLDPITKVVNHITDERINAQNAVTEKERIAANERINALEVKRDVLVAESRSVWNVLARMFLMLPFGIIVWQYIVWDKIACKWFHAIADVDRACTTDALGSELSTLLYVVYGFYFLDEISKRFKR